MTTGAFENLYTLARQANTESPQKEAKWVAIEALSPNPHQPRQHFDSAKLDELAGSIKAHGILQPILVRPLPGGPTGKYQIIAGERRFQAAKLAGIDKAPVIVRLLDDRATAEIALAENLLRDDLLPLEEATTMARLIEEFGYTYEDLGAKLGKGKNYVWHRTNLLKLPAELQAALNARTGVTTGHAEALAGIEAAAWRQGLLTAVQSFDLSVAETRRRSRQLKALAGSDLAEGRRDQLAAIVIDPGLGDEAFAQRLAAPAPKGKQPQPELRVDVRALRSFGFLKQAKQQPIILIDEAIEILAKDLKELRRHLKESQCDLSI